MQMSMSVEKLLKIPCHWNENLVCARGMDCWECSNQPKDEDKRNGTNPPKAVKHFSDGMPMCPSCDEPTYSDTRCIFCGQKLISMKIKPKIELSGCYYKGGKELNEIVCEKCGGRRFVFASHGDATDFFVDNYICDCGNFISIKTYRDPLEGKI